MLSTLITAVDTFALTGTACEKMDEISSKLIETLNILLNSL